MLDILSYRQWAISHEFLNQYGLLVFKILHEGKSIDHLIKKYNEEDLRHRYEALAFEAGSSVTISRDSDSGLWVASTRNAQNVALVPLLGALTKRGDLCSYGMRDYIRMIDRANKSEKIAAIVLDAETPGGTVDGTNELGLAVKTSKKPVVTFGDSMVASAGYWIASQSRHIVGNKNNPTEFGSIGVLCIYENWQAYIQKEIGSVEILRAEQSKDKARVNPIEELSVEQRKKITDELTEICREFIAIVKKGRGARLNAGEENIFTGKMYNARRAVELGMIDSLGSFQDAINIAGDLAISASSQSTKGAKAQVNKQMKFPKLSALFGKSEKATESDKDDSTESLSAEEKASMEAAEKKLSDMEAENKQLKDAQAADQKKIADLQKQVSDLEGQVKTLGDEKASLEKENGELTEKLKKEPAGAKTTVITKDDEKKSEGNTEADKEAAEYKKAMTENFL